MDIVMAMLAENAAQKIGERKWNHFPYSIQRNVEVNEQAQNIELYRYIVNNAMRYSKEWIDNKYGASVLAQATIHNTNINLKGVKILQKTDGLSEEAIFNEVEKTFQRASFDLANNMLASSEPLQIELPLEWKNCI